MHKSKVVVFWTAEDRQTWISSELLAGRLRQGWGIPGTQLTENGSIVPFSIWCERFARAAKQAWNWNPTEEQMRTRFGILSRILSLRQGDLAVVPKIPGDAVFTIARVTRGYIFDDRHFDSPLPGAPPVKDFGHVLQVDQARLVRCGYGSSPEARAVAAKFRRYRSAVNNVQNDEYARTVFHLFDREG